MGRKFFYTMLSILIIIIFSGSFSQISAAGNDRNEIAPDSPFYFLDRFSEKVALGFMSDEKKVDYYLDLALERFREALKMYEKNDNDAAYKLLKEGIKNISKSLKLWRVCLEKDLKQENFTEKFKEALNEGEKLLDRFSREFDLEKIAELTKIISSLIKEQIEILFE